MDYSHDDKGDALHAMEVALAMERLNLQASLESLCYNPNSYFWASFTSRLKDVPARYGVHDF